MIKLLVGLGNYGKGFETTRHNAGFMVVDRLRDGLCPHGAWREQHGGASLVVSLMGEDLRLLKPLTMMNNSGRAVGGVVRYYGVEVEEVLVVHDDIDLELGDIRIKEGGGHGGHNGLRSIDKAIGKQYRRIRCGVARPRSLAHGADREAVSRHVLSSFSKPEMLYFNEVISDIVIIMGDLVEDLQKAQKALQQQRLGKNKWVSPVVS